MFMTSVSILHFLNLVLKIMEFENFLSFKICPLNYEIVHGLKNDRIPVSIYALCSDQSRTSYSYDRTQKNSKFQYSSYPVLVRK